MKKQQELKEQEVKEQVEKLQSAFEEEWAQSTKETIALKTSTSKLHFKTPKSNYGNEDLTPLLQKYKRQVCICKVLKKLYATLLNKPDHFLQKRLRCKCPICKSNAGYYCTTPKLHSRFYCNNCNLLGIDMIDLICETKEGNALNALAWLKEWFPTVVDKSALTEMHLTKKPSLTKKSSTKKHKPSIANKPSKGLHQKAFTKKPSPSQKKLDSRN